MPYPTKKDWFEANHTQVEKGMYQQKAHPRKAWCAAEPICPEVQFLLDRGLLLWEPEQGFQAQLWGTLQTVTADAVIILDNIHRDASDTLTEVEFHFVAKEEFDLTYEVLEST
jgi:hypothetical protein